ncbi:Uncharacterized protein LW94_5884 [Fusarium fujikuroi]|nr:Uncharacterized protein LW94_5884 [Fusarium fujikuroi]
MHIKQEAIFYCAMSWARIGALVQKNKDDAINTLRYTLSQSLTSVTPKAVHSTPYCCYSHSHSETPETPWTRSYALFPPHQVFIACLFGSLLNIVSHCQIGSLYQNRRLRRLVCVGQFARPYCMLLYYIACRTRLVAGLLGTAQCLPGLKSEYKGRLLGLGCSGYGTLGARS